MSQQVEAGIRSQIFFFNQIREKLPPHISLVDEVEEVLGISTDSAYRRIRGEKELSFSEIQKLAERFGLSVDVAMNATADTQVTFRYNSLHPENFTFVQYLTSALGTLKGISDIAGSKMIYAAKDIPLFHYFLFEEIAAFKMFVWQKTILGFPEFESQTFSLAEANPEIWATGKKIIQAYNQVSSVELWNEETLNSIVRQIEFYCEASLFKDGSEALLLVDKLEEYLGHLRKQAALGLKFEPGREPDSRSGAFEMYNNEVVLSDNTVIGLLPGDRKVTFLTHNAINFLMTSNERFSENTYAWMDNLMRKSSLISTVSEKQRNQFFALLTGKIKKLRERVQYLVG